MKSAKKGLNDLNHLISIQSDNGNWNYDAYNHGCLNGMILAKSCFTDKDPKFKKAPKKWEVDKPTICTVVAAEVKKLILTSRINIFDIIR